MKTKIYQAWTKEKGKSEQVYTELAATSKKEFKKYMQDNNRIICSPIFKKNNKN